MEIDNTNQQIPPVQNIEPPQSAPLPNPSSSLRTFILVLCVVLVLMVGIGSYVLGTRKNQAVVQNQQPTSSPTVSQSSPTPDPTANWKTYINDKFGFEFKYPSSFGNLTEDGAYFRFSGNKNLFLYTSSAPAKDNNPNQAKNQCGTLTNSFLYCRYVRSADNKWVFIQEQNSFQDIKFALNALTDPLPNSKDINYATYLNFFLELPELASISYTDRIKLIKEDLSDDTKRKIDEFDQILSTFKFTQ